MSKNNDEVETVEVKDAAHPDHHDVQSDPAKNDKLGTDWAAEGGSTETGPATHTAN